MKETFQVLFKDYKWGCGKVAGGRTQEQVTVGLKAKGHRNNRKVDDRWTKDGV